MSISGSAQADFAVATAGANFTNTDASQDSSEFIHPVLLQCVHLYEQVIQELILEGERRLASAPPPTQVASGKNYGGPGAKGSPVVRMGSFDFAIPWALSPSQVSPKVPVTMADSSLHTTTAATQEVDETLSSSHSSDSKAGTRCESLMVSAEVGASDQQDPAESGINQTALAESRAFNRRKVGNASLFPALAPVTNTMLGNSISSRPAFTAGHIASSITTTSMGLLLLTLRSQLGLKEDVVMIFLAALVYIVRLCMRYETDHACVTATNWYRLTTVSILMATKMYNEDRQLTYFNHTFAKASGIPIIDLQTLELDFLYLVDFDLLVEEDDVKGWVDWIMAGSAVLHPHLRCETHVPHKGITVGDLVGDARLSLSQQEKHAGLFFATSDNRTNSDAGISYNRSALSMLSNNVSNSVVYAKESSLAVDIDCSFTRDPFLRSVEADVWKSGGENCISIEEPVHQQEIKAMIFPLMNSTHSTLFYAPSVSVKRQKRLFSTVHKPIEPISPLTLRELSRLGEKEDVSLAPPSLDPMSPVKFFKRSSTLCHQQHSHSRTTSWVSQRKASYSGDRKTCGSSLHHSREFAMQRGSCCDESFLTHSSEQVFLQKRPAEDFRPLSLYATNQESICAEQFELSDTTTMEKPFEVRSTVTNKKPHSTIGKELSELATREALIGTWRDRHVFVKRARQMFSVFSSLVTGRLNIMDDTKASSSSHGIVDGSVLLHDDNYSPTSVLDDAVAHPIASFAANSFSPKNENSSAKESMLKKTATTNSAALHVPQARSNSNPFGVFFKPHNSVHANTIMANGAAEDEHLPSAIALNSPVSCLSLHEPARQPRGSSSYALEEVQRAGRYNKGADGCVEETGTRHLDTSYDQDGFKDYDYDGEDKEGYYEEEEYYDDDDYYDDEEDYSEEDDKKVEHCRPPPRIHSPPLL